MKEMFCGQGVVQMQFVQCTKAQRTTLGTSRLWTKEKPTQSPSPEKEEAEVQQRLML